MLPGLRSLSATTANLLTIASATTPRAFFPMPRSSTRFSFSKKSVEENKREDEMACSPEMKSEDDEAEVVSNATQ